MSRDPRPDEFAGKTIERVDTSAANVWVFWFTDGSTSVIEAENLGGGLIGLQIIDEDPRDWEKAA